jgi:nitroreductase
MDVFEAISGRRSIRTLKSTALPEAALNRILDAARLAPSAGNVQPYCFVVAKEASTRKLLSEAAYKQRVLQEAPVVIVVCVDEKAASSAYGIRGKTFYCVQDSAAATQNMLLAAYALGLGTCWVGAFKEEQVQAAIKAPSHVKPVALIPVGYPNESPPPRARKSLKELVFEESFP